jgi:hypothetical protein
MPPPLFRRTVTGSGAASLAVVLALGGAACGAAAGPRYDPPGSGLCDQIAGQLGNVRATLGVTVDDDVIASESEVADRHRAECYARLPSLEWGIHPNAILWGKVVTGPSREMAEIYQSEQEIVPDSGVAFPAGSAVPVAGIGQEAVVLAQTKDWYGENWTVARVVGRDGNAVLRVDLSVADDTRVWPEETVADLVTPLATDILALLPRS